MKVRVIDFITDDCYMQMAIDEAIQIAVSENKSINTLRFYEFSPFAITYGFSQSINGFNKEKLKENNINIVKRMSGGTSVFHKNDLTYSLVLKEVDLPKQIVDAYKYLSEGLINGLNLLGVNASFREDDSKTRKGVCYLNSNPYDIVVNNKKISGNAQFRKNGVALQHGTIIIDNNTEELCEYMFMSSDETKNNIDEINSKITSVYDCLGYIPTINEVEKAMYLGFEKLFLEKGFEITKDELTDYEKELARDLYNNKYKKDEWNN